MCQSPSGWMLIKKFFLDLLQHDMFFLCCAFAAFVCRFLYPLTQAEPLPDGEDERSSSPNLFQSMVIPGVQEEEEEEENPGEEPSQSNHPSTDQVRSPPRGASSAAPEFKSSVVEGNKSDWIQNYNCQMPELKTERNSRSFSDDSAEQFPPRRLSLPPQGRNFLPPRQFTKRNSWRPRFSGENFMPPSIKEQPEFSDNEEDEESAFSSTTSTARRSASFFQRDTSPSTRGRNPLRFISTPGNEKSAIEMYLKGPGLPAIDSSFISSHSRKTDSSDGISSYPVSGSSQRPSANMADAATSQPLALSISDTDKGRDL
ncbi:hypothetical protein BV898_03940 [Hypsibius exemplaris]|uniref:Uncharacterized protein n=1 Tax=Hypsibius exemplaris TaxID=2072580 RepID=A0A1W0X3K2_HYPEX|nr:hypothetical protein BV898_03940 [Hypsibius exemplaris]